MATSTQFVCLEDFRFEALKRLPSEFADYLESGSGYEHTLNENRKAYNRYIIRPRYMVDVTNIDTSISILGHTIPSPLCVAPTAYGKAFHSDGETAIARACSRLGTAYTMSFVSTCSIEEIHHAAADGLKFFQLYWRSTREVNRGILEKLERFSFHAVMTVMDSPAAPSCRWNAQRHPPVFPPYIRCETLAEGECTATAPCCQSGHSGGFNELPTFTWEDLEWLVSQTRLPVIAKGILTAEAAKCAVDCGVAGILVSNHGGRVLDGLPATIDVLPEIVKAVAGRCEVYMDGGIRTGTDVFKALARGARAVFLGRPVVHALTVNGEEGVYDMMSIIRKEFKHTMALTGCQNVSDIGPDSVVHETFYHHV